MPGNGEEEFYSANSDTSPKHSPTQNSYYRHSQQGELTAKNVKEQFPIQTNVAANRGRSNRGAGFPVMSKNVNLTSRIYSHFNAGHRNVDPSYNSTFQPYNTNRGRGGSRPQFSYSPASNNDKINQMFEEEELSESEDEEYKPPKDFSPLLADICNPKYSYSEKMNIIADKILILTTDNFSRGGYPNMKELAKDFEELFYEKGDFISEYMGYKDFATMCLYANEITSLHVWNNDPTNIAFRPRYISDRNKELLQQRDVGEHDRLIRTNKMELYIDREMERDDLATFKEIQFRYRMCESLHELDGLRKKVEMGEFKKKYQEMHGESLNSKTQRENFSLKSNHNLTKIQKSRLAYEMIIEPNLGKKGLSYKLRHSLKEIKEYHQRLWRKISEIKKEKAEVQQILNGNPNFPQVRLQDLKIDDRGPISIIERID